MNAGGPDPMPEAVPDTLFGRYRHAFRTGEMETAPVPPTRRRRFR